MIIRELNNYEDKPLSLLLSADPSQNSINDCVERGTCFVAEEQKKIIGVFVLLPTRPGTIELANIAVTESRQGEGIGKQLILAAIEKAKVDGYKIIEVGTGNSSIGQLALYQKCHFRIIGIDMNFFTKYYTSNIFENGIQCIDMIRLSQNL